MAILDNSDAYVSAQSRIDEIIGDSALIKDLSLEEKAKIWELIYEVINEFPKDRKFHIDKEVLEELYFFKTFDEEGNVFKIPWPNLAVFDCIKWIDMSELSFKGALLGVGLEYFELGMGQFDYDREEALTSFCKFIRNLSSRNRRIFLEREKNGMFDDIWRLRSYGYLVYDYRDVNININFNDLYCPYLYQVNLSGCNLENANGECLKYVCLCDLSNTKIKLNIADMSGFRHLLAEPLVLLALMEITYKV